MIYTKILKICPYRTFGSGWNSGSEIKAVHNGNGSVSFTRGKLVPIQKNRYRREAKATESSVIATPDICCTWSWIFPHFSCSFSITTGADLRYTHLSLWYFFSLYSHNFFSRARSEMSNFFDNPFEENAQPSFSQRFGSNSFDFFFFFLNFKFINLRHNKLS